MAASGDNSSLKRLPVSIAGLSPFHEFMTKTSPVMNPKHLSKSLSANPWFSEGIGTCQNELVWKHCEISICLSNSWVVFDKSKLWQPQQSRDCNSWIKLSSYNSHKISWMMFSGGNTPEGYSLPCQTINPIEPLCFPLQGRYQDLAIIYLRLADDNVLPWFPPSPVQCCHSTETCAKTDLIGQEMALLPCAWTKHCKLRAMTRYISPQ